MGILDLLFGRSKSKGPRVRYHPSKHDRMKAWAKSKPQSYWDVKKKR